MRKMTRNIFLLPIVASCIALAGCAIQKTESAALFDLGPLRPASAASAMPPVSVAEVSTPSWLDRSVMFYRLNYQNDQQPRPYAHSRWTMPPAQLLTQRLKARIAQAGGVVLPAANGALNLPVLHIEADDFIQVFDAPEKSTGHVSLRASLFKGRVLVAQKTFSHHAPATSADASGGAHALAAASDAAIADVMQWLVSLQQK